jgi:hypothetical protein
VRVRPHQPMGVATRAACRDDVVDRDLSDQPMPFGVQMAAKPQVGFLDARECAPGPQAG